jgi:acetolactate synthase-1/2/3 large subunit
MPTVAEVLAQTLVAYGTRNYFCLTGGDHDLWIALHDAGIRIINCRSEAAAVYMADGYARVSGRPGFVYGQRGPGVANVAAAMADPYWAHSPVISLTTSIALRSRDRYEYQDVDGFDLHRAVTKWNKALAVPHRIADMVRAAIRAATGPVPGPVHLEIPADMLAADAGPSRPYREEHLGQVNARRLPAPQDHIRALLQGLASAERPLIVAGNGVVISEAWSELTQLAEALCIPVATTLGGKGAISEDHRLAVGVIGRYSRRVANETLHEADAILAIGTQLGGLATNAWTLPFANKLLYHIDTDPQVIGHNFRTELGLVADAKLALQAMLAELPKHGGHRARASWADHIARRVAAWRVHAARLAEQQPPDGIHPAEVVARLREAMAREDLLAADTGAIAAWAGALFPVPAGRSMIRSAGSLGWVVPGALGAALARPDRTTVALTGDGGLLYHIGELETTIRCNIPIVIIVLNNRAFASEHHLLQHRWGGRDIPEIVYFHDADFAAIARGFGAFGVRVRERAEIDGALRQAINAKHPALVDILVSTRAEAPAESYRGDNPV